MKRTRTSTKKIALTTFLTSLAAAVGFAQANPRAIEPSWPISYDELDAIYAADAPEIIFSSLERTKDNRYNSDPFDAWTVAGSSVPLETEQWVAVTFIPKVDVEAKVLLAAIGFESGTSAITLGLYSDNDGTVGDPLPSGEGSTTKIPDLGECCQLAKVILPEPGVVLESGVRYWLVCQPDPKFNGGWHLSNLARYASFAPSFGWFNYAGQWPAAQIRGTRLQTSNSDRVADTKDNPGKPSIPPANITIYSSLDRISSELYVPGLGAPVTGSDVFGQEFWQALPFTPKTDVHATTLAAAIAWKSGTRTVTLSIFSDEDGTVGTLLPGAEGSTSDIPDSGDCCELSRVTLSEPIPLSANVQYWLVAGPGAPDFYGIWQDTGLAIGAYQQPQRLINWTDFSGHWYAAEIRGTRP